MSKEKYLSIPELAKILGLSRIAVYRQVKNGNIKAVKIGRAYAIPHQQIGNILGKSLSESDKKKIDKAVRKTVKEYGQVLKMLGRE
jgi:excisionase family DNA binding protein